MENQEILEEKSSDGSEGQKSFKISIYGEAAKKLQSIADELKKRGVSPKALNELFTQEVSEKTEAYWERWLDEVTPGTFYLSAIQSDPELQCKLEKVIKQLYFGKSKVAPPKGLKRTLSSDTSSADLEQSIS